MTEPGKVVPLRPERPCPMCGKPADPGHRPFCSKRCADLDLGHWLGERYRIPEGEKSGTPAAEPNDKDGD
ncbi:MAG: DNA gyrase inhibitor YacG [Rhodospirillales bacterium]|nr:DNA gyrase inhibitor YacG [Rhodospirillales bacterium]